MPVRSTSLVNANFLFCSRAKGAAMPTRTNFELAADKAALIKDSPARSPLATRSTRRRPVRISIRLSNTEVIEQEQQ